MRQCQLTWQFPGVCLCQYSTVQQQLLVTSSLQSVTVTLIDDHVTSNDFYVTLMDGRVILMNGWVTLIDDHLTLTGVRVTLTYGRVTLTYGHVTLIDGCVTLTGGRRWNVNATGDVLIVEMFAHVTVNVSMIDASAEVEMVIDVMLTYAHDVSLPFAVLKKMMLPVSLTLLTWTDNVWTYNKHYSMTYFRHLSHTAVSIISLRSSMTTKTWLKSVHKKPFPGRTHR